MPQIVVLTILFYFIQTYVNNLGISSLALSIYLKEIIGLSASESANFVAIAFLPWMIKPIFGAIADRFTLFGYKFGSPKKERIYMVRMGSAKRRPSLPI